MSLADLTTNEVKIVLTTLTLAVMTDSYETLSTVKLDRDFVQHVLSKN